MARVVGRHGLHEALQAAIAPTLKAIGASLGPCERTTFYAVGNTVHSARTGAEIARRLCGTGGVEGIAQILLRETLVGADRDLGDGTARLAVMAGAALAEGSRALAAGIEPGMLIAHISTLAPDIDAAFDAEREQMLDASALARSCGLTPDEADTLASAVTAAGVAGQVELVRTETPSLCAASASGFVFAARPVEADAMTALQDVSLIVADDIVSDFRTLAPVIEGFAQKGRALVIAARGIEGQALALLERNRRAGVLTVTALTPQEPGPRAAVALEDLAIATGAKLVAERTGLTLSALRPAMLGHAADYRRDGSQVRLGGCAGERTEIALRVREVEGELATNKYLSLDREILERRRARLNGAWIELRVGHADPREAELRWSRMGRALASLRSGQRGGVIAGGGVGLARIADRLAANSISSQGAGAVVSAALGATARQIARNRGIEPGDPAARRLVESDVVDPADLSRRLLDTALSLASRLLSLERAVLCR